MVWPAWRSGCLLWSTELAHHIKLDLIKHVETSKTKLLFLVLPSFYQHQNTILSKVLTNILLSRLSHFLQCYYAPSCNLSEYWQPYYLAICKGSQYCPRQPVNTLTRAFSWLLTTRILSSLTLESQNTPKVVFIAHKSQPFCFEYTNLVMQQRYETAFAHMLMEAGWNLSRERLWRHSHYSSS